MIGKPFRSPLLNKLPTTASNDPRPEVPPAKRRRLDEVDEGSKYIRGPQLVFKNPGISSLPRKPLLAVQNPNASVEIVEPLEGGTEAYYNVLWSV